MIRVGRIRRALRTRWASVTAPLPSDVRLAALQAHDVLLLELEFGGVLDRDDPLVLGDVAAEDGQGGGLAGAGGPGEDDVGPAA